MRRYGFGIVYAIVIMVLIAGIAISTLEISANNVETSSDQKIKLQMALYRDSTIEMTMLWLGESRNFCDGDDTNITANSNHNLEFNYGQGYRYKVRCTPIRDEESGSVLLDIRGEFSRENNSTSRIMTHRFIQKR